MDAGGRQQDAKQRGRRGGGRRGRRLGGRRRPGANAGLRRRRRSRSGSRRTADARCRGARPKRPAPFERHFLPGRRHHGGDHTMPGLPQGIFGTFFSL